MRVGTSFQRFRLEIFEQNFRPKNFDQKFSIRTFRPNIFDQKFSTKILTQHFRLSLSMSQVNSALCIKVSMNSALGRLQAAAHMNRSLSFSVLKGSLKKETRALAAALGVLALPVWA